MGFVEDNLYVSKCNAITVKANEVQCKAKVETECPQVQVQKLTAVTANSDCFDPNT